MATGQRRALAVTLGHNHRGLDTQPSPSGHHNPGQRGAKSGVNILIVKQKYVISFLWSSYKSVKLIYMVFPKLDTSRAWQYRW